LNDPYGGGDINDHKTTRNLMNDDKNNIEDANETTLSRVNLKLTKQVPSISQLIKEGNALLNTEVKKSIKAKKPKTKPTKVSSNPYEKAREMVLSKMDTWKRNEIFRMEKENDKNNRWYDDFVKRVMEIGDKL
jgi:hypothetical protein